MESTRGRQLTIADLPKDVFEYLTHFNTASSCYVDITGNKSTLVIQLKDLLFPDKDLEVRVTLGCLEPGEKGTNRANLKLIKKALAEGEQSIRDPHFEPNRNITLFTGEYGTLNYSSLEEYLFIQKSTLTVKIPHNLTSIVLAIIEARSAIDFCECPNSETRRTYID